MKPRPTLRFRHYDPGAPVSAIRFSLSTIPHPHNAYRGRRCRREAARRSELAYGAGMEIRLMRPEEFDRVREVDISAFDDPSIGDLLDDLRASWAWEDELSFVADVGGEVVGHVLYTHGFLDTPSRLVDVLILSPLAVATHRQGRGVGTQLVTATLATVGKRAEPLVFLEGDPGYYRRLGFEPAAELGFDSPSKRIPEAAFMAFRLSEYRPAMTGRLVYPDPFWRNEAVGLRTDR